MAGCGSSPDSSANAGSEATPTTEGTTGITVRVGLFNIKELGVDKMSSTDEAIQAQIVAAAEILREKAPDILVLNEVDADPTGAGAEHRVGLEATTRVFADRYLAAGEDPLVYPHLFVEESNTGALSGFDLNNDGVVATAADVGERAHGDDSWGYGVYPGQYAMAILSRFPIDRENARTFRRLLWRDLPGHHIPEGWYSAEELEQVRLSSKSHWDVPIDIEGRTLRLLVSHPTPPAFDGEEDRNGRRNFDEIRLWKLYLDPARDGDSPTWLKDDQGRTGGFDALPSGDGASAFVIAGDLNAHPGSDVVYDGQSAIDQLLRHDRIQDSGPFLTSEGAIAGRSGGPPEHLERATNSFRGGLRIDYLLPSKGLEITAGGVEWPDPDRDPEGHERAVTASDHRFLWLDLHLP